MDPKLPQDMPRGGSAAKEGEAAPGSPAAQITAALLLVHAVLACCRQRPAPEGALRHMVLALDTVMQSAIAAQPRADSSEAKHGTAGTKPASQDERVRVVQLSDRPASPIENESALVLRRVARKAASSAPAKARTQTARMWSPDATSHLARGLSASGKQFAGTRAVYSDPECTFQPNAIKRRADARARTYSEAAGTACHSGSPGGHGALRGHAECQAAGVLDAARQATLAHPPATSALLSEGPPSMQRARAAQDMYERLHAGKSAVGYEAGRCRYMFCEEIPSFTPSIDPRSRRLARLRQTKGAHYIMEACLQ